MSFIQVFGKNISVKDFHCQRDDYPIAVSVQEKYVNVYVNIANSCNAKCPFCFRNAKRQVGEKFDINKFGCVLKGLSNACRINKVSFTGGEPTLSPFLLDALSLTKSVSPNIFTVINTNGYNLGVLNATKDVDSIALSRHHYLDKVNNGILGLRTISKKELNVFENKKLIHLSCNIISGLIDSEMEVVKYVVEAAKLGIHDIGFVSLMPANDYCKNKFVDFGMFNMQEYGFYKNKTWKYKNYCRCENYLYNAKCSENITEIYHRFYMKSHGIKDSQLVFTGEHLRDGFNGEVIT